MLNTNIETILNNNAIENILVKIWNYHYLSQVIKAGTDNIFERSQLNLSHETSKNLIVDGYGYCYILILAIELIRLALCHGLKRNKSNIECFNRLEQAAIIMQVTPYSLAHLISPKVREYISGLESLSISPKKINQLNDAYEMENLVDNIKLNMFQDFKSD